MEGKGLVSFPILTGNMVLLVMLHHIANVKEAEPHTPLPEPQCESSEIDPAAPVSSTWVQSKRKRVPAPTSSAGGLRKKKKCAHAPRP